MSRDPPGSSVKGPAPIVSWNSGQVVVASPASGALPVLRTVTERVANSVSVKVPKSSAVEDTSPRASSRTLVPRSEHPARPRARTRSIPGCTILGMRATRLPQGAAPSQALSARAAAGAAEAAAARALDRDRRPGRQIELELAGLPLGRLAGGTPHPIAARRPGLPAREAIGEIGRASCRERV